MIALKYFSLIIERVMQVKIQIERLIELEIERLLRSKKESVTVALNYFACLPLLVSLSLFLSSHAVNFQLTVEKGYGLAWTVPVIVLLHPPPFSSTPALSCSRH